MRTYRTPRHVWTLLLAVISGTFFVTTSLEAEQPDAFGALTRYIAQQIQSDKITFIGAQRCTEWFYKQRKQKPPRSLSQPISLLLVEAERRPDSDTTHECRTRFPEGLDSARHAFGQAQSALSISLTFYELALVGDRDDDHRYSETELRDLLESFKVPLPDVLAPSAHVAALTAQFELARKDNTLEAVMSSMGVLYDKGYRLTQNDRMVLNALSG